MRGDEYETNHINYLGRSYRCIAHAKWDVFFRKLDVDASYWPGEFQYELPGTERYNTRSTSKKIWFNPTFKIRDIGFLAVLKAPPMQETLKGAGELARTSGSTVYIILGEPEIPNLRTITNPACKCDSGCPTRFGYRMLHDGRKFSFGRPQVRSDLLSIQIRDAVLEAEYVDGN